MLQALIIEGWMAQLLGLLLIGALLSSRSHSTANRLLAAGLFCAVCRQFLITMQISGVIAPSPILLRASFTLQMLAIPMFYLYVTALTTPGFRIERKHAVHLIPFVIGLGPFLAVGLTGSTGFFQFDPLDNRERYLRVVVKVLVVIPYLIEAHRQVRTFARQSKDQVSDLTHLKLSWLRMLLIVAYCVIGVDALDLVTGPEIQVWYLVPTVGLISLMALACFSLRVSPVFARETRYQQTDSILDSPAEANQKRDVSRLSDEQLDRQKQRLIEVLENRQLYLNPELRLSDLAAALDIRPYRVSEILGRGLQTTFYDLINRYRIAQAQRLLSSPDSAHLNLLGIAMESGFKSKSVFNDVFKKTMGGTPSDFRAGKMTESPHSDS